MRRWLFWQHSFNLEQFFFFPSSFNILFVLKLFVDEIVLLHLLNWWTIFGLSPILFPFHRPIILLHNLILLFDEPLLNLIVRYLFALLSILILVPCKVSSKGVIWTQGQSIISGCSVSYSKYGMRIIVGWCASESIQILQEHACIIALKLRFLAFVAKIFGIQVAHEVVALFLYLGEFDLWVFGVHNNPSLSLQVFFNDGPLFRSKLSECNAIFRDSFTHLKILSFKFLKLLNFILFGLRCLLI